MITTRQLINQVGNYPDTRVRYPANARVAGIWTVHSINTHKMIVALLPAGDIHRRGQLVTIQDMDLPMWETM